MKQLTMVLVGDSDGWSVPVGYLYHTEVWLFFDLVGTEALPTFTAMFQLMLENANDSRAMISKNALHSIFLPYMCVSKQLALYE